MDTLPNCLVGYCALEVADPALSLSFPLLVLYPTATPSRPESVGMYQLNVAPDAPALAGPFPIILFSHGTGSSGLVHRNLAHFLTRHGYVVGLPEHPHNNRDDNTWANTPRNLTARPRHLQLAIDALLADLRFAPVVRPSVTLIGHSLGGYTALALAGGQPWSRPADSPDGRARPIPVPAADPRVRALVLLAPAVPWFQPAEALAGVRVPILLMVGEQDDHTPPAHVDLVQRGVPATTPVTFQVVPKGGHFSFLSPFPAERVSPGFPPSQDPPGFNRAQFQSEFMDQVVAFIRRALE